MNKRRFSGLTKSARAWYSAKIAENSPGLLIICSTETEAEEFASDLSFFAPEININRFPAWDCLPFEMVSPSLEISGQRIQTALHAVKTPDFCVVTSVAALVQKIMDREMFESLAFNITIDQEVEREILNDSLQNAGFKRTSLVESIGEYAVRGNVVDLFPASSQKAIRINFFDNLVTRISTFDVKSQRTLKTIDQISILPVREVYPFHTTSVAKINAAVKAIKTQGADYETPPREVARYVTSIEEGINIPGQELVCAVAVENYASLLDYLPTNTLCILNDEIEIAHALSSFWDQVKDRHERLRLEQRLLPNIENLFLSPASLFAECKNFEQVSYGALNPEHDQENETVSQEIVKTSDHSILQYSVQASMGSGTAFEVIKKQIDEWLKANYKIAFVVGSKTRFKRLTDLLADLDIHLKQSDESFPKWINSAKQGELTILSGHLEKGFVYPEDKFALVSENEVFSKKSYRTGQSQAKDLKKILNSIGQLKAEDFVVHEDYGIGRYKGLKHLTVDGREGDFLHLEYADSKLYVPAHNVSKVSKYVSADNNQPQLDKLGSQKWNKTKAKVRQAVSTLAGELINLYAERSTASGFAYEPFNSEDKLFADSFPYDETSDQLQAIDETLKDMAQDKPMDRLICGDVGFGKTEVALRAAHKCVQSGKQVAILVPTTILVEQHKNTFLERFRGYPVNIKATSRFYSSKDNKETIAGIASGKVDIAIGTHKLLSKNVAFKDLGMLIVDEEHRFGVKQKEQLKQYKKQVDVLTLTATPIPRTLHMAMVSIRDISVITTPPTDRRVIKSYMAQRDETLIRDALLREKQRGGQSFFVHNRVETIGAVTEGLQQLCPELTFEFGHGQMTETQLEKIMQRFLQGETDVLVCTTIIESGIDIPNANTILIDRADMFGLAQLYQIRGRVGRSSKQAYCYFLVPPLKKLAGEARQRLKALQALDDLGQGFHLALRDLEIRGAGNLLGKEQSGNVFTVGFDLYAKILNEAVHELSGKAEALQDTIDPDINLRFDAFIPEEYIPDISERLILYQRLTNLLSYDEAENLRQEIVDRFGNYGEPVENLLVLMHIRILCRHSGIYKLDKIKNRLIISFSNRAPINLDSLIETVNIHSKKYRLSSNTTLSVNWEEEFDNVAKIYSFLQKLIAKICLPIEFFH